MSKDDAGLRRDAKKQRLNPLSPSTASTPPGVLDVSSSCSSSFGTVSTPPNQRIQNYEAIGLSPGSLKDFDVVQAKIDEDGILNETFDPQNPLVFRCIYFLYGRQYAWNDTRDMRVEKIRQFVEDEESRDRLRYIACPDTGHLAMSKEGAFEMYCRVALIAEHFFRDENARGGFRQESFARFQRSANCYVPASCVWCTLQRQHDQPENEEACKPLDVAQMGRKYAIETDEDLENRVLHNKGMSALAFASKLVGREPNGSDWVLFNFGRKKLLGLPKDVWDHVESVGYGLVTNFHVSKAFKEAAKNEEKEFEKAMEEKKANESTRKSRKKKAGKTDQLPLRYLKFDGCSIDTKGEVVEVDYDEELNKKQKELRLRWEKQVGNIEKKEEERRKKQKEIIPDKWRPPTVPLTPPNPNGNSDDDPPGGSGMHAMVLLGAYKEYKKDAHGKLRLHFYFMLLNSWHSMPLVLVSPEYLQACKAKVYFLDGMLGDTTHGLERDDRLFGETSFFDGGDDREASASFFLTGDY